MESCVAWFHFSCRMETTKSATRKGTQNAGNHPPRTHSLPNTHHRNLHLHTRTPTQKTPRMNLQIGDEVRWNKQPLALCVIIEIHEYNYVITCSGERHIALKAHCKKIEGK